MALLPLFARSDDADRIRLELEMIRHLCDSSPDFLRSFLVSIYMVVLFFWYIFHSLGNLLFENVLVRCSFASLHY